MKTINEAMNDAYHKAGHNAYFGNGFLSGIEFAQKWFDVMEEMPDKTGRYLIKAASDGNIHILNYILEDNVFLSPDTGFAINDVTYWRPINIE